MNKNIRPIGQDHPMIQDTEWNLDFPRIPRMTKRAALDLVEKVQQSEDATDHLATESSYGKGHYILPAESLISCEELMALKTHVIDALEGRGFQFGVLIPKTKVAEWDQILGQALWEKLKISIPQSNDKEVWTYLSVFVFYGFAEWRYPTSEDGSENRERLIGERRNVLRKCWIRVVALGPDLLLDNHPGSQRLSEDELVAIFERPTLGDDKILARAIATHFLKNYPKALNRPDRTKTFAKAVLRLTPSINFAALGSHLESTLSKIDESLLVESRNSKKPTEAS